MRGIYFSCFTALICFVAYSLPYEQETISVKLKHTYENALISRYIGRAFHPDGFIAFSSYSRNEDGVISPTGLLALNSEGKEEYFKKHTNPILNDSILLNTENILYPEQTNHLIILDPKGNEVSKIYFGERYTQRNLIKSKKDQWIHFSKSYKEKEIAHMIYINADGSVEKEFDIPNSTPNYAFLENESFLSRISIFNSEHKLETIGYFLSKNGEIFKKVEFKKSCGLASFNQKDKYYLECTDVVFSYSEKGDLISTFKINSPFAFLVELPNKKKVIVGKNSLYYLNEEETTIEKEVPYPTGHYLSSIRASMYGPIAFFKDDTLGIFLEKTIDTKEERVFVTLDLEGNVKTSTTYEGRLIDKDISDIRDKEYLNERNERDLNNPYLQGCMLYGKICIFRSSFGQKLFGIDSKGKIVFTEESPYVFNDVFPYGDLKNGKATFAVSLYEFGGTKGAVNFYDISIK